ncbi:MAG: DUF3276 family protein [Spirochaetaceae bacterium]|nr:DUF3276 family protein [Spirochaetaceae bacterium]
MGIRGEIFSTKVILENRTYFFNVKENRLGDLYLNIVESKNRESGGFERQSVILFESDLREFLGGFDESLRVLEKAAREKRRPASGGRGERGDADGHARSGGKHGDAPRRDGPPGGKKRFVRTERPRTAWDGPARDGDRRKRSFDGPARDGERQKRGFDGAARDGGKRAVVKTGKRKNHDGDSRFF